MNVTVLSGGVGGAKLVEGLATTSEPGSLTVIPNIGDDCVVHGLHVSPDPDIITYTLADVIDREKGWGIRDDTFELLEALSRLGEETWFNLGDRDLATHVYRTERLRCGDRPSVIATTIAAQLGVETRIVLPTDDPVRTHFRRHDGWVQFQEHYVRDRCRHEVVEVAYRGAEEACATPETLDAIAAAELLLIAPSNPIASIDPILAIPGLRAALIAAPAPVIGVCPLIAGRSLKGPTDRMMRSLGGRSDAVGIVDHYDGLLDGLLIDVDDRTLEPALSSLGVRVGVTGTIMTTLDDKQRVAAAACELA